MDPEALMNLPALDASLWSKPEAHVLYVTGVGARSAVLVRGTLQGSD